jgi:hypothetical protein
MLFLDKKEEVIDIELTQFGKHKLSIGEFKPVYYAFFDGDILYDQDCADLTGSQNSIEPRIQEDTPRLQAQYNFEGRETAVLRGNEIASIENIASKKLGVAAPMLGAVPGSVVSKSVRVINDLNGDVIYFPDAQAQQLQAYYQQNVFQKHQYLIESTTRDRHYSFTAPLGTSDLAYDKPPKWSVTLLSGEIDDAEKVLTGSYQTERIPQVNVTLTYETMVATTTSDTATGASLDGTDPELASEPFEDGTYIAVRPEHLLADIKEEYANYTNENFDIEVMERDSQSVPGLTTVEDEADNDEIPFFKYLYFEPEEITIKDGILLDEPITPVAKDIADETKFVNYFMDVLVDQEIDRTVVCNAIENLKVRDIYIDSEYDCPDVSTTFNASLYDPTAEVCATDADTSGTCD